MALLIPYSWRFPQENPAAACERSGKCPVVTHIQQKAAQLAQFQEQLLQKQKKLNQRQQELERWNHRLQKQQQALTEGQQAQKAELEVAVEKWQQRQETLNWREYQLQQQELQLQEKAASLRRQADVEMEQQLRTVRTDFMNLNQEMKQAREHLVALTNCVQESNRSGVEQLCRLYRTMVFSREPALLAQAQQLGQILQLEFGAEAIEPNPGEAYDSVCHERLDTGRTGGKILRCLTTGWRWRDEMVLRAVVDTEEGSESV